MPEAVIVDAVRTPIGKHGGALSGVRPDDLAATVVRALVERSGVDPMEIDDVILGCANQSGEDNRNVARMSVLLAGLPVDVPGQTVNRLCGSGLQAIVSASQAIKAGEGSCFIAGGVESMSRAPWVMLKPQDPFPRSAPETADTTLGWRFINPAMPTGWTISLGETAENVAEQCHVSREDQDAFALESQQRTARAVSEGRFAREIVAVEVQDRRGARTKVERDEHPRADATIEKLRGMKPAFRTGDGTVTAGSSSAVPSSMAPVAPSGWPSAIAPPLTLTVARSAPVSRCHASTTDANASLISTRSISSSFMPALSSAYAVAGIGAVSIHTGSAPRTER